MEDVAFTILGAALLFFAALAGGWVVIVVGASADGAPGCAMLVLTFWAIYILGFLVEYPGPGLATYAGLACGIWLGLRTVDPSIGKSAR